MPPKPENTFFTKDIYENDNSFNINEDMLASIRSTGVKSIDQLFIGFVYLTDTVEKANQLKNYIADRFPHYSNLFIEAANDYWEISGNSEKVAMNTAEINQWNNFMWDLGYQFDCMLDGWQIIIP